MTTGSATGQPDTNGRRHRQMLRPLRLLPAVTLIAVLTITASAEFQLARTVLALPPQIAWAVPVAIDSYVLAAMRSGRDVVPAMSVMAGALAASLGAHLSAEGEAGKRLPVHVVAPAATAIMVVLVVVAWRVHVLIESDTPRSDTATPPAAAATSTAADPGTSTPARTSTRTGSAQRPPSGQPSRGRLDRQTQPHSRASAKGLTDEQILAALGEEAAGLLPSVRGLMSEYRVGQRRATRLRRAVADAQAISRAHSTAIVNTKSESHPTAKETDRKSNSEKSEEPNKHTKDQNAEVQSNRNISAEINDSRIEDQKTHTCITDRVGPPSPAGPGSGSGSRDGSAEKARADFTSVLYGLREH